MASNLRRSKKTIGHSINDTNKRVTQLQKRSAARRLAAGTVTSATLSPAVTTTLTGLQTIASGAQSTADGKNAIFYATGAPTATSVGDLWFDTDADYKLSKWNGTTWESFGLGSAAFSYIDAGKITAGILSSIQINAGTPSGGLYPFSVSTAGVLRAISGTVGGFTLGSTTLSASAGTPGIGDSATIEIKSNGAILSHYEHNDLFGPDYYEDVKINNYADGGSGAINIKGTAGPGYTLSEYWYTSYGPVGPVSDVRLKTLLDEDVDALSVLSNVLVTKYVMTADESAYEHFGFVAQQLHEHIPAAVSPGGDDLDARPWSLLQHNLIPYLVKAVQQLAARVEELESRP